MFQEASTTQITAHLIQSIMPAVNFIISAVNAVRSCACFETPAKEDSMTIILVRE